MYRTKSRRVAALYGLVLATTGAFVYHSMIKKKKVVRRFKVRPLNRKRDQEGSFATLVKSMETEEQDLEQYFLYTRMTPNMFKYLLEIVGPKLQKNPKKYHLSPAHQLMMTLHYLSSGVSMQEIAWNYRVGKATVHVIIKETCEALWDGLSPQVLAPPTQSEWSAIADGFFNRWNMPNCIGAVDGKHVQIKSPKFSGSSFFNYKKTFNLVLMGMCDAYYRFILVDIGAAGANHDSAVFNNSGFGQALLRGNLNIPEPKNINKTSLKMNFFVVADQAFPLHKYIMRPYPGTHLGEKKNIFNYRLSRARRVIENTFGILVQRWQILKGLIVASVEMCEKIVQAIVVLHNFIQRSEEDIPLAERRYCPTGYIDYEDADGLIQPGVWRQGGNNLRSIGRLGSNNASSSIQLMRDNLADYFISPVGCVPWQSDYVSRGSVPNRNI